MNTIFYGSFSTYKAAIAKFEFEFKNWCTKLANRALHLALFFVAWLIYSFNM